MTAAQILSLGGLTAATLTTWGGLAESHTMIATAGAVMIAANVAAYIRDLFPRGGRGAP